MALPGTGGGKEGGRFVPQIVFPLVGDVRITVPGRGGGVGGGSNGEPTCWFKGRAIFSMCNLITSSIFPCSSGKLVMNLACTQERCGCGCGVSRRYIDVCYCDMFSVVNVYLDHLKFYVMCINSRRYVCCSECDVVSNECNEPTSCLVQPIGAH